MEEKQEPPDTPRDVIVTLENKQQAYGFYMRRLWMLYPDDGTGFRNTDLWDVIFPASPVVSWIEVTE